MSWIRIRIPPSGSDFYNAYPNPRIRIRITDDDDELRRLVQSTRAEEYPLPHPPLRLLQESGQHGHSHPGKSSPKGQFRILLPEVKQNKLYIILYLYRYQYVMKRKFP